MDKALEIAKANLGDVSYQAARTGRALVKRINICKRLVTDITEAKKKRKSLNRFGGKSTKYVDLALKTYREELEKSEGIRIQLQKSYSMFCQQSFKEKLVVKAIEEAIAIKEG